MVVFDVELIAILTAPTPPSDLASPPESATTLPSGLKFRVLEDGSGVNQPKGNDGLLLAWTGWDESGAIFDSTELRGKPTLFPLDKMPAALADCSRTMVEGESRRCWVPTHLSSGMWAGTPKGTLVFDIQLLRIMDGDKIFAEPPQQ
jgi:FKBP-type peptidyl-prolyl cis-trans isomerase